MCYPCLSDWIHENISQLIFPSLIEYLNGGTNIWTQFNHISNTLPRIQNNTFKYTLIALGESHIGNYILKN